MEYVLFGEPVDTAIALARHAEKGQVVLEKQLSDQLGLQFETRPVPPAAIPGHPEPLLLAEVVRHKVASPSDTLASSQTTAILGDQSVIFQTAPRNGTTDS